MATDFAKLFIPPKHDLQPLPQTDFYRMLAGIGDSLVAAQDRARQERVRDDFKMGLPRRADGAIDYAAMGDMLGRSGADIERLIAIAGQSEAQRGRDIELERAKDFARVFGGRAE